MTARPTYRKTPAIVVRARQLLESSTPEGQFGRVAAPEPEFVRSCINACICPWCGSGPYKVLALHTFNRHGVSGQELRQYAGLRRHDSICDPDHSDRFRELRREDGIVPPPGERAPTRACIVCGRDIPFGPTHASRATCGAATCDKRHRSDQLQGKPKTLTPGFRRAQSERAKKISPELHRKAGLAVSQENHRRSGLLGAREKRRRAALAQVLHGTARTYKHGCRCEHCGDYRAWVRGRRPEKPLPVPGRSPCHPGCGTCAEYDSIRAEHQTQEGPR